MIKTDDWDLVGDSDMPLTRQTLVQRPLPKANREEVIKTDCSCIIHGRGSRFMSEPGYMLSYKLNGEE